MLFMLLLPFPNSTPLLGLVFILFACLFIAEIDACFGVESFVHSLKIPQKSAQYFVFNSGPDRSIVDFPSYYVILLAK